MDTGTAIVLIVVLFILLVFSAFFSASETAFTSLSLADFFDCERFLILTCDKLVNAVSEAEFTPLNIIFEGWKKLVNKIFRLDKKHPTITEEEFSIIALAVPAVSQINPI